jgi:hypothetical protein
VSHIEKNKKTADRWVETEQDNLDVQNFKVNVVTKVEIANSCCVDPEQACKDGDNSRSYNLTSSPN